MLETGYIIQIPFVLDGAPHHTVLQLQLGAGNRFIVALFTLLPVNDIPDLVEILIAQRTRHIGVSRMHIYTHRSPGIKVLQVVRMLPDIDANDGYMTEKRVLVGCCDDLEGLCLGIPALPRR